MKLSRLFAQNPFSELDAHLNKTIECVEALSPLFDALKANDQDLIIETAKKISILEHEADVIKHDIRKKLPKSIFMPVDRRDVLQLLHQLDSIADFAEDIGVILTLRPFQFIPEFDSPLTELHQRIVDVVIACAEVVKDIEPILERGFARDDVERMMDKIDHVGHLEHLADKAQDIFGKKIFEMEDSFKPAELYLWIKFSRAVGDIADAAERVVGNVRLMMTT